MIIQINQIPGPPKLGPKPPLPPKGPKGLFLFLFHGCCYC